MQILIISCVFFCRIIASRNSKFPIGKHVTGSFGWRTHTVVNPSKQDEGLLPIRIIPDISPYPVSLGLGVLGMPG